MESTSGPTVYTYTRNDAIAAGVLVDVSATAHELGLHLPVAMTAKAHAKTVAIGPHNALVKAVTEDERLHDVLWMFRIVLHKTHKTRFEFGVAVRHNTYASECVMLKASITADEHRRPVITLALKDED